MVRAIEKGMEPLSLEAPLEKTLALVADALGKRVPELVVMTMNRPRHENLIREIRRAGPSYTVDTLNELLERHQGATFFIVMGADQALQFHTWRHWQQIAANATLAIAQRHSASESQGLTDEWHNQHQVKTVRLHMPLKMVSATDIRSRIRQGALPTEDLTPSVSQYIQQHHLYLDQHD